MGLAACTAVPMLWYPDKHLFHCQYFISLNNGSLGITGLVQSLNGWIKEKIIKEKKKKSSNFTGTPLCLYVIGASNRRAIVSGIYNKFNVI